MSRVGENIKKLRIENGITQKALGKKIGVNEKFINEVELGRKVLNEALIAKISQILGKEINDIGINIEDQQEDMRREVSAPVQNGKVKKTEDIQEVWSSAFSSVLRDIPVYNYTLSKPLGSRLLPVKDNKIEGHSQDKVLFLTIQDDDMSGFRISKGDTAFAYLTTEVISNGIFLIEYNSKRIIRQVKRLDNSKLLLISNGASLHTDTVGIKEIKIVAKLEKVEIKL